MRRLADFQQVLDIGRRLPAPRTVAKHHQGLGIFEVPVPVLLIGEQSFSQDFLHADRSGFADAEFDNLFGGLALTPLPTDNYGILRLHEIYHLPLQDCELAVLSACETNVGPQQQLDAGVTLASGFLASGARRVVASHWNVADRATADLMHHFFEELTADKAKDQPLRYAHALQQARFKIRAQEKWSSPYFWAPFVLIGPGE